MRRDIPVLHAAPRACLYCIQFTTIKTLSVYKCTFPCLQELNSHKLNLAGADGDPTSLLHWHGSMSQLETASLARVYKHAIRAHRLRPRGRASSQGTQLV
jgi:hypothetical protein